MTPPPNTEETVTLEKIYTELRAGIRETDNISFRLLGLVPLVSGVSLIAVILKEGTPGPVLMLLSLFAAGVTLGIFRWELRNSQTCKWLIRYADRLEQHALNARHVGAIHHTLPNAPQNIGKTEGEMVIYGTTILAWLGLPLIAGAVTSPPRDEVAVLYSVCAAVILGFSGLSLFAKTNEDIPCDGEPKKPGA
jgi:hypothetical protein